MTSADNVFALVWKVYMMAFLGSFIDDEHPFGGTKRELGCIGHLIVNEFHVPKLGEAQRKVHGQDGGTKEELHHQEERKASD